MKRLAALAWLLCAAVAWADPAAEAYLARLEPVPADIRRGTFEPAPGIVLETMTLAPEGPARGTVVFVPGYATPLDLYGREMRVLAEAGWRVAGIVMRGQGRSTRLTERYDLGHQEDYADLTCDLAAFVAGQPGPVVALGISQGAHVSLRMVAERETPLMAVATLVPMIDIAPGPPFGGVTRAVAAGMAANGAGRRYLPGTLAWDRRPPFARFLGRGTVCQPDPELAHLRRALMETAPELRVEVPSWGFVDATYQSIDRLRTLVPRIEVPVLMVTAGRDGVVRTAAAARMCRDLKQCRRAHLPEAPHCMVEGDPRRSAPVMEAVIGFFGEVVE